MSLTSSDQWVLARIEIGLRRSDPKLAGMLAVFTYISRRERGPAAEQLSPWRPRLSLVVGAILIAVNICLVVAFEFVLGRARRAEPAIPGTESWRRPPSRWITEAGVSAGERPPPGLTGPGGERPSGKARPSLLAGGPGRR